MERASLHVTRSSLFNFVGERKRNDQNSTSILVISVFLPRFNALPITITIESARFFETTLGVFSQRSTFLLLLTMDCRGRVRDKADAEIGRGSSKPQLVLLATFYFIYFF